jgi:hypothetical protein
MAAHAGDSYVVADANAQGPALLFTAGSSERARLAARIRRCCAL